MRLRLITAGFALALVVPVLFFGGMLGIQLLCLAATVIALWEYGSLRQPPASTEGRVFAIVLAWLPILAAGLHPHSAETGTFLRHTVVSVGPPREAWVLLAVGISFLAIPAAYTVRGGDLATVPGRMASTLFGVVYLGFTLSFCVLLRALPNGLLWIVFALATVWLGDTGAYVGGRAFGKHKMAPTVSPKKTWEGLGLGLATSVATGFAARGVFEHFGLWEGEPMAAWEVLVLSLISGGMGVLGDLAESLLKRAAGVKDSGSLFPGHGGMLDRIDALLFAVPSVYFWAEFVHRWGS